MICGVIAGGVMECVEWGRALTHNTGIPLIGYQQ